MAKPKDNNFNAGKGARKRARKVEKRQKQLSAERQEAFFLKTLNKYREISDPVVNITSEFTKLFKDQHEIERRHFNFRLPEHYLHFIDIVNRKAPKLIEDSEFHKALYQLASQSVVVNEVEDWKPGGKGSMTQFRSLCNHLLAAYSTPPFVWTAFFDTRNQMLAPIAARVASGESLFKIMKADDSDLPLPFNRRMVHDFMLTTTSKYSFIEGLRRAQVRHHGGDARLLHHWMHLVGGAVMARPEEGFWDSVLAWICKHPMIAPEQYGPIIDYIRYRRTEEPDFSMKGRSPMALMRAMEEWHHELAIIKDTRGVEFQPSGLPSFKVDKSVRLKNGDHETRIWRIKEILCSKQLAAEGRYMKHCVYSYSGSIERGYCSIWSLTFDDGITEQKRITIEVRNRWIAQRRGRCNRPPHNDEDRVIYEWAQKAGLKVQGNRW